MVSRESKIHFGMIFLTLFSFALLLRFTIGIGYFNSFDTYWYRNWAVDLPNGLFSVYQRATQISLDYPPLYLLFLYPIGLIYKAVGTDIHSVYQMFLMKFWPIIFDCLVGALIYFIFRKKDINIALIGSTLWLLNPSTIYNSAFWGQTDSIMVFFLILSFYYLSQKRESLACIFFAVAGLIKYQSLFFVPVFLLELWLSKKSIKYFLKGILSAALTVIAVFLPFMIGSKKLFLFFEVYFGGAGTYKYCTLNAFNFYGLFGLNWASDENVYGIFAIVVTVLFTVLFAFLYIKAKNRCVFSGGFIYMQFLFIFVTRMHERYQFVVLGFVLVAFLLHKTKGFLISYILVSVITLLNQMLVLVDANTDGLSIFNNFDLILKIGSGVNILIFAYTVFVVIEFFMLKGKENKTDVQSVQ